MSLKSFFSLFAIFVLLIALAGCSNAPITANAPLYALVVVNQQLQIDVISRPTYQLAGTISVQQVGDYPPNGAIGVGTNGSLLVTYAGSVVNGQYAVSPNTESCSLQTAQCTTLIDGWGNNIVDKTNNHMIASICNNSLNVSQLKCQIAFVGNDTSTVQKRVTISPFIGSVVITPDEKFLYGIRYKTNVTPQQYEVIRFDLAQGKITATHNFGKEVPQSLALAPDGTIYASILYASQSSKANANSGTQPHNQPGTHIEMFTPDLTPNGTFTVGQYPLFLAISPANGGTIALTYASQGPHHIDLFQAKTGTPIKQFTISPQSEDTDTYISTLTNGHFAVTISGPSSFSVGDFIATDSAIQWHKYSGSAINAVVN